MAIKPAGMLAKAFDKQFLRPKRIGLAGEGKRAIADDIQIAGQGRLGGGKMRGGWQAQLIPGLRPAKQQDRIIRELCQTI